MKLITDGDKWAIKEWHWLFGKKYFDFVTPGYWWGNGTQFFNDCWTDKKTAETWFKRLSL